MRPSSLFLPPFLPLRSPTFSSEEDNDPLTDDGPPALPAHSSLRQSAPSQHRSSATLTARPGSPALRSRLKHTLSPYVVSDDGVDSPTYDGDIESSATIGRDRDHPSPVQPHSAVTSTLPSPTHLNQDLPAVISIIPPPSTASSSDAEMGPTYAGVHNAHGSLGPASIPVASQAFTPSTLSPEDIQAFVRRAISGEPHRKYKINEPPTDRPVRVYADGTYSVLLPCLFHSFGSPLQGVYDLFHFGYALTSFFCCLFQGLRLGVLSHSLQLRQAKHSFPKVYLLVGVNNDEQVKQHKFKCVMDYAERCEAAQHCRWVDEVVPHAPWVIDAAFIEKHNIDYVAHDEEPYLSAGHDDVYGFVKSIGLLTSFCAR